MSAKRKRTDDGKAKLKQRLTDLLHGALGNCSPTVFDGDGFAGIANEAGLEAMGRWLGAIGKVLLTHTLPLPCASADIPPMALLSPLVSR